MVSTDDHEPGAGPPRGIPIANDPPRSLAGHGKEALRARLGSAVLRPALVATALAALALLALYPRWFGTPGTGALVALGILEATQVTVSSEVTARILEIPVGEGQAVRAGDVLVRLDDALPQLQLRLAAPAEQQVLQLQLSKYVLHAPRDGVVLRRSAEPGEVAVAGAPLLVVAAVDNLEVTLYVLQRDLSRVYVDQQVVLQAEALPGSTFAGRVKAVSDRAEFTPRSTQTPRDRLNLVFAVTVRVQQTDRRLKPGLSVVARFVE